VRSPRLVVVAAVAMLALAASAAEEPATPAPPAQPEPGTAASGAGGGTTTTTAPATVLPGATRPGTLPPVVTNGPRTGNQVALTFDADMTDSMLYNLASGRVRSYANTKVVDILQERHTPATFFLTGEWAQRYPDVTRRLVADPRFEFGNHTYRHLAFTANCYHLGQIAPNLMADDVARTFAVIEAFGGRQTRYFRFPGGCYDDAALRALAPLGVTVVQWDVVSGDPFATEWQPIVQAVLSQVRPGSIVVMHITEANAPMTDEALPPILDGLAAKGLQPVTLSELLGGDDRHRPGDRYLRGPGR
jgi:peptidoglycan/xylan/chitin deacetylase (PgdA/CDA1 family)